MNEDLTAWRIIAEASVPVQAIMVLLLLASIISWLFILKEAKALRLAKRCGRIFEGQFWSGIDLNRLYQQTDAKRVSHSGQQSIFYAGFKEYIRCCKQQTEDSQAIMAGIQRTMRVALSREQARISQHLSFLATVGSVSPYIGLFGTVWGIMNSFMTLAGRQQVSLQVIAPDIAEALIATAMGLFVAIPAVIAYNRFTAQVEQLSSQYIAFADEFTGVLHRRVHTPKTD